MLAGLRSIFPRCLLLAIVAAAPVQAQTPGVAPSVTSMGFGGKFINGVAPGVTSVCSNGYGNSWSAFGNCCANFFWPNNANTEHHHHHKKDDSSGAGIGVIEPVYIPYAVADAPEDDEDSVVDEDSAAAGPRNPDPTVPRAQVRDAADTSFAESRPRPDDSSAPIAAQLSTVLVFKDGHRSEVHNYAIAGDTLFDFDPGRARKIPLASLDLDATRKANDDRGVDFQIPASTGQ
jgi:hypothetical protein